ncbi:MAG TPA: PQQ-binding-like beta-propeller repeat protein [Blastocatellia bacterium]|nr:PQQ-binding-like beta-propeller repeat protein [Blastocatellia bacterium]
MRREVFARSLLYLAIISFLLFDQSATGASTSSSSNWSSKFDGKVRFHQTTELGALIVGTEKSVYAVDGETGEVLWRRKDARLDEADIAPVVGTDLLLLSFEKGGKTRVEAVDLIAGNTLWRSDKIKGGVMQMAVDPENDLAAVVFVRDAKDQPGEGFKRRPTVYMLNLATGEDLWKRDLDSEIEMTPAQWGGDGDEAFYTLDNYRAPFFLDGRLWLFYEGVTSLDARTGKEGIREKFRVNEEGLALTEADPVVDDRHIYVSGRGRVRAISRETGREVWEAKDLGLTPELILANGLLFVRTGGQFTRLKDGDVVERGPYGVSAIDPSNGKTLWRYRGADKGITNIALANERTALIADRDELIAIDTSNGKVVNRLKHRIDRSAFVLINELGQAVIGGRNEIAGFDLSRGGEAVWRARHNPPGRGVLRTIGAITARAASIYFRYGGVATTAFRGVQLARGVSALRWSGLASRAVLPNLTDYAAGAAREYVTSQIKSYGVISRADLARRTVRAARSRTITPQISIDVDVEERLMDRLDPAHQLDKLSRFLGRRRQLAALRGQFMYFYTELKPEGGRGLAGVNLNTGQTERTVVLEDLDYRFSNDEIAGLIYVAKDNRLTSHKISTR